ncbi:hypothetical protein O9993_11845 [Vibrio lentus]|nr:hypothetical protein [Vibrio lentus]
MSCTRYHRDGAIRVDSNFGSTLGYEPNNERPMESNRTLQAALNLDGAAAHWDHREDENYFSNRVICSV